MSHDSKQQSLPQSPVIHIISDSLGDTATEVVNAAAAQFPAKSVKLSRLSKVKNLEQVKRYIEKHHHEDVPSAVFHTIVDPELRDQVRHELRDRAIPSIDLLGPAITVLATLTGLEPQNVPGALHKTDKKYFDRVEGMEYFVSHDNGQGLKDLQEASAVLVGSSRTSKTPLSMYLAFMGYKIANLPLDADHTVPEELRSYDKNRIFGLLSNDSEELSHDQNCALQYMKDLDCHIIENTDKTIEEVASEIIKIIGQ